MTPPPRSKHPLAGLIAQLYAAALFGIYAVVILLHPQPALLGDLSNWTYSGVLVSRHMHGVPDAFHSIRYYPVPNTLNTLLLAVLSYFMRWQLAVKVYLLLQLMLSYFAMRTLARAVHAPAWVWVVAPGAVFFGINFWYGLFAFQMGVCFVFILAAMLIRRLDTDLPDWPIGAMLILLFFTHMVTFTLALVLVFFFALQVQRPRLLLQAVLPTLLAFVYAAFRFAAGNPDSVVAPPRALRVGSALFWGVQAEHVCKVVRLRQPHRVEPLRRTRA